MTKPVAGSGIAARPFDPVEVLLEVAEQFGIPKIARELGKSQQRDAMRVHQCLERLMATLAAQIRDMPRQLGICAGDEQPRSP